MVEAEQRGRIGVEVGGVSGGVSLNEAFAYTRRIASGHYENFPVGSLLLPRNLRQHVYNIYAFARIADDFADEPEYAGERQQRLEEWREELCQTVQHVLGVTERGPTSPVFVALAHTLRERDISPRLLNDLLTAFILDVRKDRYAGFGELLHYCRHSANPVGRLMLQLFGYGNEHWMVLSDHICTALQLANFWQDVSLDLQKNGERGRIYLPQDEMRRFGVAESQLFGGVVTKGLRELMKFQVERTRGFFTQGRPLCDLVPHPRLRLELKLTWLGGMRILERITQADFNVFSRPCLSWYDAPILLKRLMTWKNPTEGGQLC